MLIYCIIALTFATLFVLGRKYKWHECLTDEGIDDYLKITMFGSAIWPITILVVICCTVWAVLEVVWAVLEVVCEHAKEWIDE